MEKKSLVDLGAQLAPLSNFFGDELLTLLYCSSEEQLSQRDSKELAHVRALLSLVSDATSPKHQRAAAAVDIGRFVREREDPSPNRRPGMRRLPVRSISWFRLARELGSVVGASELANALLAREKLGIAFNPVDDVLPRIVSHEDFVEFDPATKLIPNDVVLAWREGSSAVYRRLQRKFDGWDKEHFQAALVCIGCYLTFSRSWTAASPRIDRRRSDLSWINPVWNALIKIAPDHLVYSPTGNGPEAIRQRLIEQRLAILHGIHEVPGEISTADTWVRLSDFAIRHDVTAPTGRRNVDEDPNTPSKVVILKGEIPAAVDRSEKGQLKQYEALAEGVPLVSLPSLDTLQATQAGLIREFPWADEAITSILSDLFARRRTGSRTLGMGTFLLVGEPSSGKTRFAQKLSERLGTPSLVCNLAGMSDSKTFKGCTRGWGSARPSRIVEFVQQTRVANPLFILDEIDKLGGSHRNGDPHAALLDLLEPGNARRYMDVFLMAECDLSHCIYIATANSLRSIPKPLMSRMQPVFFPRPGAEHASVLIKGVLGDFEASWGLPAGALSLADSDLRILRSLTPREMRAAIPKMLGRESSRDQYRRH